MTKQLQSLTIELSEAVHRDSGCPGDKLKQTDPLLSIHQQDSLQSGTHGTKHISMLELDRHLSPRVGYRFH